MPRGVYKDKEKRRRYTQKRDARRREANVAIIRKAKNVPCMDCGVKYPYYVMDLDHREPDDKSGHVTSMAARSSKKRILQEIEKCDVVCANCHRERTFGS